MKLKNSLITLFIVLFSALFFTMASASPIQNSIHFNIQVEDAGVIQTGTFSYQFNVSLNPTCTTIVYSNTSSITTDIRGIASIYLNNLTLNFTDQYYLCLYRGGTAKGAFQVAPTPYAYYALNTSWSGVIGAPTNLSQFTNDKGFINGTNVPFTNQTNSFGAFNITAGSYFGKWNGSIINVTLGGTGLGNYTKGDIIIATTNTTLGVLNAAPTGNVIKTNGVGQLPSYGQVNLATEVAGDLPVTNLGGGTNANSNTAWFGDATWKVPKGAMWSLDGSGNTYFNTANKYIDINSEGNTGQMGFGFFSIHNSDTNLPTLFLSISNTGNDEPWLVGGFDSQNSQTYWSFRATGEINHGFAWVGEKNTDNAGSEGFGAGFWSGGGSDNPSGDGGKGSTNTIFSGQGGSGSGNNGDSGDIISEPGGNTLGGMIESYNGGDQYINRDSHATNRNTRIFIGTNRPGDIYEGGKNGQTNATVLVNGFNTTSETVILVCDVDIVGINVKYQSFTFEQGRLITNSSCA